MSEGDLTAGTSNGDDVTVINDENTLPTPDGLPVDGEDNQGTVDREFYNLHDGTRGRLKGRYLDEVEREEAENLRAKLEGREPDYENAPATAGTPLVVKGALVDNSVMSNPSSQGIDAEPQPIATLPVDQSDGSTDADLSYASQVAVEDQERGTATAVSGSPIELDDTSHPDSAAAVLEEFNASQTTAEADTHASTPDNVDHTDLVGDHTTEEA